MAFARSYHNLTLLPDGTVLASGGQSNSDGRDLSKSVLPAEIWNPDTETWTTVDALQNGRLYHSTALAPARRSRADGRRRCAPAGMRRTMKNAEIYSPPYLFKGARPTITYSARDDRVRLRVSTSRRPVRPSVDKVSLIRLPSVTHGLRPEPALPVPELLRGRRQGDGAASGDGQPRAPRRLHALPAERAGGPVRRSSIVRLQAAPGHGRPDRADEPRRERRPRTGDAVVDSGHR